MDELKAKLSTEVVDRQSKIDYLTLCLIAITTVAQTSLCYLQYHGMVSFTLGTLGACFLMNMSFTFWHECSHGNLSGNHRFNAMVGILSSFFSFFPGYFARRREHLIHHRFEGIPDKDPVYHRIQNTSFTWFVWTALKVNYFEKKPISVPPTFLPISPTEKWIDRLTVGSVYALCAWLFSRGHGDVALAAIVFPRVFIFLFHGYVICFFPHFMPSGGYQRFRIFPGNALLKLTTMNQCYHGIHHFYPKIRWYNYPAVYKKFHREFQSNNIEIKQ